MNEQNPTLEEINAAVEDGRIRDIEGHWLDLYQRGEIKATASTDEREVERIRRQIARVPLATR